MKQIYYTSCVKGRSVNGNSGFQIRAATAGLTSQQLNRAASCAGYRLPEGMIPCDEAVKTAPVRLAFYDVPGLGRVLLHSVYAGREGDGTRQGNFFTHMLVEMPPTVDAGRAINTWGSPFWQRQDDATRDTELPEDELPKEEDALALRTLDDPAVETMLRFLLNALLLPELQDKRIILAAPADEVALCLTKAAVALPFSFLRSITFSTYESSPLSAAARVVGTCWARVDGVQRDLPSSCYEGTCVAYNRYTNRSSKLPGESLYAQYAYDKLRANDEKALKKLTTWLENNDAGSNVKLLDLSFRILKNKCDEFSLEEMAILLRHKMLGSELVRQSSGLKRVIQLSKNDAGFALTINNERRSDKPLLDTALELIEEANALGKLKVLEPESRNWAERWLDYCAFNKNADLKPGRVEGLFDLVNGLHSKAKQQKREELLAITCRALLNCSDQDSAMLKNVIAITRLFSSISGGKPAVYRAMWRHYLDRKDKVVIHPALIRALLSVGVGHPKTRDEDIVEGELERELNYAIKELRRHRRTWKKAKTELQEHSKEWDKEHIRNLPRAIRTYSQWWTLNRKWIVGLGMLVILILLTVSLLYVLDKIGVTEWLRQLYKLLER